MAGYNARLQRYSSEYNDRYKRDSSATARLNTALSYCSILYSPVVSQVSIHRPVPYYIDWAESTTQVSRPNARTRLPSHCISHVTPSADRRETLPNDVNLVELYKLGRKIGVIPKKFLDGTNIQNLA